MIPFDARSWVLRDLYPDVLCGLYLKEEMEVVEAETTPQIKHKTEEDSIITRDYENDISEDDWLNTEEQIKKEQEHYGEVA